VVRVAIAIGDVEGSDSTGVGDGNGQNMDGSCGGWLKGDAALEQTREPEIGFDGDDAAAMASLMRRGDGEQAYVGADVPDGVAGMDKLASKIEEVGVQAGIPVAEARVGCDVDGRGAEVLGEASPQDAIATYSFGKGPERCHRRWWSHHDNDSRRQIELEASGGGCRLRGCTILE